MRPVLALSLMMTCAAAVAQSQPEVMSNLRSKYPKTTFTSVTATPVPGIYEVVMGKNVAYTDASGRYFFFGNLYDMTQQQDLTEPTRAALQSVDTSAFPVADAIKVVRGSGRRTLFVFSDPDCPFCRTLERNLLGVTDVTVYTFMFPIVQIHPEARRKAIAIWCSGDRVAAWVASMTTTASVAAGTECAHPIDRNIKLAERLGVRGTPTMFSADGRMLSGAVPAERINAFLDAPARVASGVK